MTSPGLSTHSLGVRFCSRWLRASLAMILSLPLMFVAPGCGEAEKITQYTVTKPEFIEKGSVKLPPRKAKPGESYPGMIVGVFAARESLWAVKLSGPQDAVKGQLATFRKLVDSLKFGNDGNLKWELPPGWKTQPGNQFRFATLEIPATADFPELEVTISKLPRDNGNWNEQLLANVNRWRQQLQILPLAVDGLKDAVELFELDGVPAAYFQAEGTLTATNPNAPMMGGGQSAAPREMPTRGESPPDSARAGPVSKRIAFQTPEGWKAGVVKPPREAAFQFGDGELRGECTVIALPEGSGSRLENVNRWRNQAKLPPLKEGDLKDALTPLAVHGEAGVLVECLNESDAKAASILGVFVDHQRETWYLKMTGPAELLQSQKENFLKFAESLKFIE